MCTPTDQSPAMQHGELEQVFANIWYVRGAWYMPFAIKARISRSMTIIRDEVTGDVTLVNSMRLSEQGLARIEAIGPIKHVIRLAAMHGADDAFYRERYGAKIHALRGTIYARGLSTDVKAGDSYFTPDEYFDRSTVLPIRDSEVYVMDSPQMREASILIRREGGILLSGDYFHNTEQPDEFTNGLMRFGMKTFGLAKACNMGVGWLMMTKPSRSDLLALLDIPFEHVLPIHGLPVIGGAKQRFRPAIEKFANKAPQGRTAPA